MKQIPIILSIAALCFTHISPAFSCSIAPPSFDFSQTSGVPECLGSLYSDLNDQLIFRDVVCDRPVRIEHTNCDTCAAIQIFEVVDKKSHIFQWRDSQDMIVFPGQDAYKAELKITFGDKDVAFDVAFDDETKTEVHTANIVATRVNRTSSCPDDQFVNTGCSTTSKTPTNVPFTLIALSLMGFVVIRKKTIV